MNDTEVRPGFVEIKSTFINNYKQTQIELDYHFVDDKDHLTRTIKVLHDQLKEYFGAKSDINSTWRYYD